MRSRGLPAAGLLLTTLLLLSGSPTHATSCEVLTQTSGEKITSAACRILEGQYFAHTPAPTTGAARIATATMSTAEVSSPPPGLVMEMAWLQPSERRDLPMLLAYLSTLGARATLELPSTRYNDEPIALLSAYGGAVLEREATEPIGATREIAEAFVPGGNSFLLLDDFIPHPGSPVRRKFTVPPEEASLLVTVLITDPTGTFSLTNPSGASLAPTRRSAKAIQWDIAAPAEGEWTITAQDTLRTRLYVQAPDAPAPTSVPACQMPGPVEGGDHAGGTWRLDRVTPDGLRFVAQGNAGETPRIPDEGTYAMTCRANGRLCRHGIHAGLARPILYRISPLGVVGGETTVRCNLLGMNLPSAEEITASVGGSAVRAEIAVCGEVNGLEAQEVRLSPGELSEGPHRVEIGLPVGGDSWVFTLDRPVPRDLRISEIHLAQGWIEIEALAGIPDLSAYGISDLESGPVTLPAAALAAGERLVVQYRAPEPGMPPVGVALSQAIEINGRDEVALTKGGGEDFAILDAVVIDDGETVWSQAECSDTMLLVERGEWTGPPAALAGPHASLGRIASSDANAASDFRVLYYPSPTAPNAEDPALAGVRAGDVAITEVGVWERTGVWIEIEVKRGPIDISAFSVTDLDGDPARIGQTPRALATGERLVIRFERGPSDEHSQVIPTRPPGPSADQAVILLGQRIIDAVGWRTPGEEISPEESRDFTRAKIAPHDLPPFVPGAVPPVLARFGETFRWNWTRTPGEANAPDAVPALGAVRILSVSPSEFGGDWAEIVALSGPVDVSRFVLTDLDGEDNFLASSPVTLGQGEKALVHWGEGTSEVDGIGDANGNGARDIYLTRDEPLSSTDDQLVLVWGNSIYDAVVFTNGDGRMSRDEQKDLLYVSNAGEWSGGVSQSGAVNVGTYRLPVERIDPTRDTNSKDDWRSRTPVTTAIR